MVIRDEARSLENIREAIQIFDIPVRQVMIEARIVVARDSTGKDFGIRWGGGALSSRLTGPTFGYIGGSLEGNTSLQDQGLAWSQYYSELSNGGTPTAPGALQYSGSTAPVVNLPSLSSNSSSFAIGFSAMDYVLDLELSAAESRGSAEVISQPKIITTDGGSARVLSGTEIPYSSPDGTQFKLAVLSMVVSPQITPDQRLVLDLTVTQDSLGANTDAGPTINKNELNTQVLVDNGETLVLGGVYRIEEIESVNKTPFLGDLPIVGKLFRNSSTTQEKSELLIFITPKLIEEGATLN
jgi:type IV pilus assembly protein PilQ